MTNVVEHLVKIGHIQNMTDQQILSEIIDEYQGTCQFLSDSDINWLEEHGQLAAFDEVLFECEVCGWWYEIGEQGDTDQLICESCFDEQFDE